MVGERGARPPARASRRPRGSVRLRPDGPRHDLKLGLQLGYWTAEPRPARELVERGDAGRGPRLRLGVDRRVVELRRLLAAALRSRPHTSPIAARHRHRPDLGAHPDRDGHARDDARRPLRGPRRARPRRQRPAGGRGLVRPAVRQAARPHPRVRRHRAPGAARARRRSSARARTTRCPTAGEGAVGLGKPLKMITHPLRADIPIFLGAEGPKNVALAAEIADGWVPLYYSPYRPEVYAEQLAAARPGFEIAVNVRVTSPTTWPTALWPMKATLGFYIGGMGAKTKNFHTELMARMGYEEEAHRIQDLFFEGKRDEAIAAVPDAFADEISLVGPEGAHRRAARGVARDARHDAAARRPGPRHAALPGRPHDLTLHQIVAYIPGDAGPPVQPRRPLRARRRPLRRPRRTSSCEGERRTYAEMEERANRLAHHLAGRRRRARRPRRHLRATTRSSGSRRCGPSSRSAPSGSTSTTATSRTSSRYLFDNADLMALVYQREFAPRVDGVRDHAAAAARTRSSIDDGSGADLGGARLGPLRGRDGRRLARARLRPALRPTTATSSTPAAPPACRRASCGATRTCSSRSAAASTPSTGDARRAPEAHWCEQASAGGPMTIAADRAAHARRHAVGRDGRRVPWATRSCSSPSSTPRERVASSSSDEKVNVDHDHRRRDGAAADRGARRAGARATTSRRSFALVEHAPRSSRRR